MLVEPKLQEVVTGKRGMLTGIQACLDAQCLVSAVTLMFSTIDALAALTRPVKQLDTNSTIFREWTIRFLQPDRRLGCTAQDLWGARCGVLHTYSPEANVAAKQGARRIFYRWRAGPPVDATRQIPAGSLVLVAEDLHAALVDGARDYMLAAMAEPHLKDRLQAHLPPLLCYEPFPTP